MEARKEGCEAHACQSELLHQCLRVAPLYLKLLSGREIMMLFELELRDLSESGSVELRKG